MRTVKLTQPDAWRQMPPSHPHPLRVWLTDRGSLTARISAKFSLFNLQRLSQKFDRPFCDERRVLGVRIGEMVVVREVLLRHGNAPLVFAHSAVRGDDLHSVWRGLSRLGARPLAEMLFNDPQITRMPVEYRQLDARDALFRRARTRSGLSNELVHARWWARRSVFLKHNRPLLVTEVFLGVRGTDWTRPC